MTRLVATDQLVAFRRRIEGRLERQSPEFRIDASGQHEPFALSDIQRAYVLGRAAAGANDGVSSHGYLELRAERLDVARYEDAWNAVIARHGMLRTVITPDGLQQELETVGRFVVSVHDHRHRDAAGAAEAIETLRQAVSHRVADVTTWPALSVSVSLMPDGEDLIHISSDAIFSDIYSFTVIQSELYRMYHGSIGALAPLSVSYRDYINHIEERQKGEAFRRAERFWLDRLDSLPRAPMLPVAESVAATGPARFRRLNWRLPAAGWEALQASARRSGFTPALVLLAAYAEVLRRWARQADFTLNVTLFDRPDVHPELAMIVGDFTSLMLLPLGVPPDGTFTDRLGALRDTFLDCFEHRHYSGVRVIEQLSHRIARGGGDRRDALMPVVFTCAAGVDTLGARLDVGGERIGQPVYMITQTPQVSIDNQIFETAGCLEVNWDSIAGLFPEGVIEAMFSAYCSLLSALSEGGAAWTSARPVRAPDAQVELRAAPWRADATTPAEASADPRLHAPLLGQIAARGEAEAVVWAEGRLSYRALGAASGSVAAALRAHGVGRGDRVAVMLAKGWRQVVAALGILRAGAAYVPIDPDLPAARKAALVAAVGARVAVSEARLAAAPDWPAGLIPLPLDETALDFAGAVPDEPALTAEDLAYVIFTSGSTGQPKGVAIDHGAARLTLDDVAQGLAIGPEDAVLGLSSLSFDLSVFDLFGVLGAGGRLVLPGAGEGRDARAWLALGRAAGVSVWNTVPALFEMAVAQAELAGGWPERLRVALLSGDWIPTGLAARAQRLGSVEVVSLGGATEAAVWSVAHRPVGAALPGWPSVPYGRPLRGQSLRVLGPDLEDCPDWVTGDLYIGGGGLARGYWGDPMRTAAQFVRHPSTGERLYRTGDLARYRPGGVAEFMGRADDQVKVGGYRIELGEIEAALSDLPGVGRAVAYVVGEGLGRRLLACVVPAGGEGGLDGPGLKAALGARLPSWMVPLQVQVLERLPLSGNGKVDRSRLPRAASAPEEAVAAGPEPQSPVERLIAAIIAEELERQTIPTNQNFFDLGGDSLTATRLAARLRQEHGLVLQVGDIYRHPVLRDMARRAAPVEQTSVRRTGLAAFARNRERGREHTDLAARQEERS